MVGAVKPRAAPAIPRHVGASESRVVVTWEGPGQPIMLTLYGPEGEVNLPRDSLTLTAAPTTSAGRFSPLGPLGIGPVLACLRTHGIKALTDLLIIQ